MRREGIRQIDGWVAAAPSPPAPARYVLIIEPVAGDDRIGDGAEAECRAENLRVERPDAGARLCLDAARAARTRPLHDLGPWRGGHRTKALIAATNVMILMGLTRRVVRWL